MLTRFCYECGWEDTPRIPEKLPINIWRRVFVTRFRGFSYEIFDRYGQLMESSQYYNKEEEAVSMMKKTLKRGETDKDAGPYTALMFPDEVEVRGKVFKVVSDDGTVGEVAEP